MLKVIYFKLRVIWFYDTGNISYVYVWCITNSVYRQQKCNFRVVTVRLADFDIPEKVPKERKLSHLFSYMMVHTHKLGQRFCRSLTRAIVLSIKRKNNIYSGASGLLHSKKNIKFHQVLEKFWRNTKPHLTFMPLCISLFHEGEFTDCKNEHVLWLMRVYKCVLMKQMLWCTC